MTDYDLPNGRLTLTINRADLPPDELFALGARANPRRAFLFVSKVLGKHSPVATTRYSPPNCLLRCPHRCCSSAWQRRQPP